MINPQLKRLARVSLIYGAGTIINRFISFLLLPVFTKYLTPADYGVSSILAFIAFFIQPVLTLGFGTSLGLCYFDQKTDEHKQSVIWSATVILTASVAIVIVSAFLFSREISQTAFQSPEYGNLVIISMLGTAATILVVPPMLYLQFEERAVSYVIASVLGSLISIGLMIYEVVFLLRGILGLVEAIAIGQAITLLLFLGIVAPKMKLTFSKSLGRALLRLGIPIIPGFAFVFLLQNANRYILQYLKGLDAVGIYTVGFNLGLPIGMVIGAFGNAWTPFFLSFTDKKEEAATLFRRITTYYVMGFGFLTFLFFAFAKPFVMVMTQPPFHGAYSVVGWSAASQFFIGLFSVLLPAAYLAKEAKYITIIQGIAAVFSIAINIILIHFWGKDGAGIGLAVGLLSLPMILYWWNLKRGERYIQVQYEWKRLTLLFTLFGIISLIFLIPRNFSLIQELLFSFSASIFVTLLTLALLTEKEKSVLRDLRQRFLLTL